MNIVKLNNSHHLHYAGGYTYALRFPRKNPAFRAILSTLLSQGYAPNKDYRAYQSRRGAPAWIGVRDERVLTHALLCAKL